MTLLRISGFPGGSVPGDLQLRVDRIYGKATRQVSKATTLTLLLHMCGMTTTYLPATAPRPPSTPNT